MKCKIYLNDGEDHFFGFQNEFANHPELTMVHSFDVPDEWARPITRRSELDTCPPYALTVIYDQLNAPYPDSDWAKNYRRKMLRSLSVGDVVVIGEVAFSCEPVGWKQITTDELNDAIIWDDDLNCCPK